MSDCYEQKLVHDACFYKWYHEKFLTGTAEAKQPCDEQFKVYRACLEKKFAAQGVTHLLNKSAKEERGKIDL